MKKIYLLVFSFAISLCHSQDFEFAIIKDTDGYVNVRSSKEISNNIIDKVTNGTVVSHFGPEGNWVDITYNKNNQTFNGYVYYNRVVNLSSLPSIPQRIIDNDRIILSKGTLSIELTTSPFVKSNHSYTYYKDNPSQIEKIDGKESFGTDGNLPKLAYKSISITIDGVTTKVPYNGISNLYEPNLTTTRVYHDETNQSLYIETMNSDGAGSYALVWVIEKGIYKDRFIAIPF
ncbi:hypothetical protein GOQ30_03525 [Flavobacterium sp. TP390]|uniref:SH3b domain-containing protein n=1 Tax=Flavobacterium profundi TaxID=1774945 RepID=A0A6I4IF51_9FLAO|nr:hypothetical protein [Flavobacterium profundi]MVO08234.1 hypothetical protein [Flavobacterium profundi]